MDDPLIAGIQAAAFLAVILLSLVNIFKGKYWFSLLGLVTGLVIVVIGAIRLAKPDSAWARRFYPAEKMKLAIERFPEHAAGVELDPEKRTAPPVGHWLGGVALAVAAAIGVAHS